VGASFSWAYSPTASTWGWGRRGSSGKDKHVRSDGVRGMFYGDCAIIAQLASAGTVHRLFGGLMP